ncbi:MAG: MoxR family ATPase [Treponemataceae bacterium]
MDSKEFQALVEKFLTRMSENIIGQRDLCRSILMAYIAGGHVLLEGVPGLAKTLTVKTFANLMGLSFKRIQFTPDLLPADIIGTLIFHQGEGKFAIRKGPIFSNIILADEINRAPAKVQSALLEGMAESQVTIGERSYRLPQPFFVLATQNPIEQDGTYPLPEAELDRFLMKLHVPYPSHEDEVKIVNLISQNKKLKVKERVDPVFTPEELMRLQTFCSQVLMDESLTHYIVSIVEATRPVASEITEADFFKGSYLSYITLGASPRASIGMQTCAKIEAAFSGRNYVTPDDIKKVAYPILRHRLKLSYEAIAENLTADNIVEKILSLVQIP